MTVRVIGRSLITKVHTLKIIKMRSYSKQVLVNTYIGIQHILWYLLLVHVQRNKNISEVIIQ